MRSRRRDYIAYNVQHRHQQRVSPAAVSAVASTAVIAGLLLGTTAFTAINSRSFRTPFNRECVSFTSIRAKPLNPVPVIETTVALFSSVGDGGGGGGGDKRDENNLGDFLDPMKNPDSEGMKRAREYMSETSLPISFDNDGETSEENFEIDDGDAESADADLMADGNANDPVDQSSSLVSSSSLGNATSSALFGGSSSDAEGTGLPPTLLAKNPYMQVVSRISPSDLIAKFTAESDPRVQEAVRTTILGLIGSLPKLAFETTSVTTGQRLASLMFQLQMTGYMFKNAEYRLSMSQSLGMSKTMSSNLLLAGVEDDSPDKEDDPLVSGKIKGKLKIRYGKKDKATDSAATKATEDTPDPDSESKVGEKQDGTEIEVDAAAYMSELRDEVSRLRDELTETKESKDEALRKDLLLYIRTLPAQELKSLTNTMSQDVLVCMKGLVQAVLAGIGDGKIGPDTVTEQSGEAMAQLCMWQLAVGYNLRELEVREEMKNNMKSLMGETSEDDIGLSEPGAFE